MPSIDAESRQLSIMASTVRPNAFFTQESGCNWLHGLKLGLLGLQNAVCNPVVKEQYSRLRLERVRDSALLKA